MPQNPTTDKLAALRAIVDAGGPQKPVRSHAGDPGGISRPSGLEKNLPLGDEFLSRVRTFPDLMNEATLGVFGNMSNPLEAATPPIGGGGLERGINNVLMPTERRMGEMLGKFGGTKGTLAMDEASRMARAAKQGYTHDVFHGTTKDFSEFADPVREGSYGSGDFGIHVSSDPGAANLKSDAQTGLMNADGTPNIQEFERGSQVMPLKAKMDKTLTLPDMSIWKNPSNYIRKYEDAMAETMADHSPTQDQISDPEFLGRLAHEARDMTAKSNADPAGFNGSQLMTDWQHKLSDMLRGEGYDSVKYANHVESDGAPSYLLLDPRQVRSKFATFDPRRTNSRNLLASLAAAMGLGGAAGAVDGQDQGETPSGMPGQLLTDSLQRGPRK